MNPCDTSAEEAINCYLRVVFFSLIIIHPSRKTSEEAVSRDILSRPASHRRNVAKRVPSPEYPSFPTIKRHPTQGSFIVVVTAYDFESGRPGSNPEWGPICYKASINAQGLPEPSSLRGSTLGTRTAEHKGCNWGMQADDCSLALFSVTDSVVSAGICHRNKVN